MSMYSGSIIDILSPVDELAGCTCGAYSVNPKLEKSRHAYHCELLKSEKKKDEDYDTYGF